MTSRLWVWVRALRVEQWTKNGVVMMAWFFSVADSSQREIVRGWESFLMAVAMAGAFSLVSSAFYLLNDVSDFESDRLHPVKRRRARRKENDDERGIGESDGKENECRANGRNAVNEARGNRTVALDGMQTVGLEIRHVVQEVERR